jgi:hypothetical protein
MIFLISKASNTGSGAQLSFYSVFTRAFYPGRCATIRKFPGSIPGRITGDFDVITSLVSIEYGGYGCEKVTSQNKDEMDLTLTSLRVISMVRGHVIVT